MCLTKQSKKGEKKWYFQNKLTTQVVEYGIKTICHKNNNNITQDFPMPLVFGYFMFNSFQFQDDYTQSLLN
jgi:hypothetical protein